MPFLALLIFGGIIALAASRRSGTETGPGPGPGPGAGPPSAAVPAERATMILEAIKGFYTNHGAQFDAETMRKMTPRAERDDHHGTRAGVDDGFLWMGHIPTVEDIQPKGALTSLYQAFQNLSSAGLAVYIDKLVADGSSALGDRLYFAWGPVAEKEQYLRTHPTMAVLLPQTTTAKTSPGPDVGPGPGSPSATGPGPGPGKSSEAELFVMTKEERETFLARVPNYSSEPFYSPETVDVGEGMMFPVRISVKGTLKTDGTVTTEGSQDLIAMAEGGWDVFASKNVLDNPMPKSIHVVAFYKAKQTPADVAELAKDHVLAIEASATRI